MATKFETEARGWAEYDAGLPKRIEEFKARLFRQLESSERLSSLNPLIGLHFKRRAVRDCSTPLDFDRIEWDYYRLGHEFLMLGHRIEMHNGFLNPISISSSFVHVLESLIWLRILEQNQACRKLCSAAAEKIEAAIPDGAFSNGDFRSAGWLVHEQTGKILRHAAFEFSDGFSPSDISEIEEARIRYTAQNFDYYVFDEVFSQAIPLDICLISYVLGEEETRFSKLVDAMKNTSYPDNENLIEIEVALSTEGV